jgi:hypothetical protein
MASPEFVTATLETTAAGLKSAPSSSPSSLLPRSNISYSSSTHIVGSNLRANPEQTSAAGQRRSRSARRYCYPKKCRNGLFAFRRRKLFVPRETGAGGHCNAGDPVMRHRSIPHIDRTRPIFRSSHCLSGFRMLLFVNRQTRVNSRRRICNLTRVANANRHCGTRRKNSP